MFTTDQRSLVGVEHGPMLGREGGRARTIVTMADELHSPCRTVARGQARRSAILDFGIDQPPHRVGLTCVPGPAQLLESPGQFLIRE